MKLIPQLYFYCLRCVTLVLFPILNVISVTFKHLVWLMLMFTSNLNHLYSIFSTCMAPTSLIMTNWTLHLYNYVAWYCCLKYVFLSKLTYLSGNSTRLQRLLWIKVSTLYPLSIMFISQQTTIQSLPLFHCSWCRLSQLGRVSKPNLSHFCCHTHLSF